MKKVFEENEHITANSKQLALLKKRFPQCFDKNGAFMPKKMNELVKAEGADINHEGYSLNWLGKSYARLLANENPRTMLQADDKHNAKEANKDSNNLLIQGDNLEVLKHLVNAYSEKVKMIYIDPPYNTGSDGFVYEDDRKFTKEQLSSLAGIDIEEAERILDFTQRKSNSHSAWLTFMYPRLYIARELLREDGVIFISIDDNEQAQLKMLCDEVFGEGNFEGHIHWRRRNNQPNDKNKMIGLVAEHIFCYALSSEKYKISGVGKVEITGKFSNPDNDLRGDWASKPWTTGAGQSGTTYEIKTPTGKIYTEEWMGEKETFDRLAADNRIVFPDRGDGKPRKKYFYSERLKEGQCGNNWWQHNLFGHNQEASAELSTLFNGIKGIFSNPKPIKLLKNIINISNVGKNNLILDFFAGSGTTAHAVMQLNAEDGGNRQCISVQLDEKTDPKSEAYKAGYQTIFEITKARIEKAAQKIKADYPDCQSDLGVKIFKTTPIFNNYLDAISKDSMQQALPLPLPKFTKQQLQDLLLTWKTYDGIPLTQELAPVKLDRYTAYYTDNHIYFMATGFATNDLKAFITKLDSDPQFSPAKLVIFGFNFDSKYQREIQEALAQYKNKKAVDLDIVVRY